MLTPPIKIEDKDNFLQEVQRLNNIYIYGVDWGEWKKNHDTKIIRSFVEGLNKVIYEFWATKHQISRSYWEHINVHWFSGVRRF